MLFAGAQFSGSHIDHYKTRLTAASQQIPTLGPFFCPWNRFSPRSVGYLSAMTDRSRFVIVPIGSLHTGWALKVDGVIRRSNESMIPLGAYGPIPCPPSMTFRCGGLGNALT